MQTKLTIFIIAAVLAFADFAPALERPPQPEFWQQDFLFIEDVQEMNLDYALLWSDSAAGLFIQPFDGVILHVETGGRDLECDVFIFSDIGMNRLTIWLCTAPDEYGHRQLRAIRDYDGEDASYFSSPSGMTTNARNRKYDPKSDLVYLADRGNDRIVALTYYPDEDGGELSFNYEFGRDYLEWPVDVELSAYLGQDEQTTDIYVVDWGHVRNGGKLSRFDLSGNFECSVRDVFLPPLPYDPVFTLYKPVSIACYPDTIEGQTHLYITEERNTTIYQFIADSHHDPWWGHIIDMEHGFDFAQPGGVAVDDVGRLYFVNTAANIIENYGPYLNWHYDNYPPPFDYPVDLICPSNIIIDTYHGEREALLFQRYFRESGLRSYIIEDGFSIAGQRAGFSGRKQSKPQPPAIPPAPAEFMLSQNYPNPFNSSTVFEYSLGNSGNARIEIFNILGERVALLFNGFQDAGPHSVAWDAKGQPSGVYYAALRVEGKTIIKKSLLLK